MKNFIIFIAIISLSAELHSQSAFDFPMGLWRKKMSLGDTPQFNINGKGLYDTTIKYEATYLNPNQTDPQHRGFGVSAQFFYVNSVKENSMAIDSGYSATAFDCREGNSSLQTVKYNLIACKLADSLYVSDKRYKDVDFFLVEFIDTLTQKTLAIEFSSMRCEMLEFKRKSYLLMCNRYEYYSRMMYIGHLYDSFLISYPNGAYLFEIIDSDTGRAVGIRYYCANNEQEYTMFFR